MKNPNSRKARYLRYAALVMAILCLVFAAFFFLRLWEQGQGNFPTVDTEDPYLQYGGKQYERKENLETILVLGLDKFDEDAASDSYNNDQQADFLLLLVMDHEAETYAAIQINRDTMVSMNVLGVAGDPVATVTKQIALAHTYGNGRDASCQNTAASVSKLLLNMPVDHYISLTMDSVPVLNDFLGGVEVEVLDDFTGIDDTLVKGTTVTLMGQQALTYVRTRAGLEDSSNTARMERQRQYLNALRKKATDQFAADDERLVEATLEMADYIVSDRSVTQLQDLLRKFSTYEFQEVSQIRGESKMGEKFMEFYPEQASVEEIVVQLFYKLKN